MSPRPRRSNVDEQAVFINVPYDEEYEPVFIGLVAGILSLGRVPRCVLELPDDGSGRMERLFTMVEECRTSFHDMSREGTPARHNMPFEFGLTYARRKYVGKHSCFILERRPNRTIKTLSDARQCDCLSHKGKPGLAALCVLDALGRPSAIPNPLVVEKMRRKLMKLAGEVKRMYRQTTLFNRAAYLAFRNAAVVIAEQYGFTSH